MIKQEGVKATFVCVCVCVWVYIWGRVGEALDSKRVNNLLTDLWSHPAGVMRFSTAFLIQWKYRSKCRGSSKEEDSLSFESFVSGVWMCK